ncbi:TLC domain-containing protein [Thamnocephalis sphaerospora]|uniref:TLC domain-containing protein n=1 Tax=Thamnocephalis sphaerospora TaxID=78915 RepID=A0A4P9XN64_9FUNG|nr:TLC domain-containing protein [Thamnocephalis sphaerospora]|eukprot:RKP07387.1 TLC domain-containing protein [Thamnocephalis sphaerospora]
MPDLAQNFVQLVIPATTGYALLHAAAEMLLVPLLDARRVAALSVGDRIDLGEKLSSTLHSLHVGIGALWLLLAKDGPWSNDTLHPYPDSARHLLADHAGYTLYDLLVMLAKPRESGSMWAHHLLGAAGALAMLYYKQAAYFPVAFLATELTVPVVNALWMFDRFGGGNRRSRLVLVGLRALAYVLFRLLAGPLISVYAIKHHQPLPGMVANSTMELPATRTFASARWQSFWAAFCLFPMPVWLGCTFNLVVFSGLNVLWTHAAMRAFLRELGRGRHGKRH